MFHEEVCIHFTLYINKYIIVLFSGDAESRGERSDPEANADCMKTRERKKEGKRKRDGGRVQLSENRGEGATCVWLLGFTVEEEKRNGRGDKKKRE